ncbi:MAG: hypothetical protein QF473_07140 [Planctomycetota bacterium]|jgi:hypothetical protein|nr:hypothetical protein [Planctomycetota bacterium]
MHETILYPTTADNTKALKRFLADIAAHTRLHPQMTELNDPDIAFVEDGAPRTVQVIWLEEVDSDEPLVTSIGVVDEDEDEDFSTVFSQEILTYTRTAKTLARNTAAAKALLAKPDKTGRTTKKK